MKTFLLVVLVVHIILESLVGGLLVVSPNSLMPEATGNELSGLIIQGMCALNMVILAVWLLPYRDQRAALSVGLGTLASFHTLLILSLLLTTPAKEEVVGYTHHLVLGICFWILWSRRESLAANSA